jgi:hypothetical protein
MTRIRNVGLSVRTILLVGALLLTVTAGGIVTAGADSPNTTHSIAQQNNETELTSFTAESQGGYVSFSEETESDAEGGTPFPALEDGQEPIQIQGEVNPEDGTWESQNLTFPTLTVSEDLDLQAEIETVDGLEGEINPEEGVFTAEGEFRVTISGSSFTYQSTQTTAESGDLSGSADFSGGSGEVTLVDNEFTVDEQSDSPTINNFLELPADEPGENWIVLRLDVSLNEEQLEDRSGQQSNNGEDSEGSEDTKTLVLTVLGQALGFAGLGAAVLTILVTLGWRVRSLM